MVTLTGVEAIPLATTKRLLAPFSIPLGIVKSAELSLAIGLIDMLAKLELRA